MDFVWDYIALYNIKRRFALEKQMGLFVQVFKCPRCGKLWKCVVGDYETWCYDCKKINDDCPYSGYAEALDVQCDDCDFAELASRR